MGILPIFVRPNVKLSGASLKPLPWINEEIIRFEWKKVSGKHFLSTLDLQDQLEFEIDPKVFEKITSHTLSRDISHTTYQTYQWFTEALNATEQLKDFSEWWKQLAIRGGKTPETGKLFQFDFKHGPWEIPWELLLGLLRLQETRQETTLVRCIGQPIDQCESFWAESLRILIIKANAPDLDLEKDVGTILDTWNGLEKTLREAVQKPKVIQADRSSIIEALRDYRPHLIWFLGHGYYDGIFHLKFSKDDPITAKEFSQLFDAAGHHPEFAVFWACESAKGTSSLNSGQPDLFEALSSQGVGTMVGMQSLIADDAAITMANQLFRGVAQGLPLEWAIAKARTWIYEIEGKKTPTMDWAAPVVWMSRRPIAQLKWNQTDLDKLQLQLLGSVTIGKGQQGAGLEAEPPDNNAVERAKDWLSAPVTVVRGDPESTEHRLWFLRTLKGLQTISKSATLVVVPGEGHYHKKNIQDWAQGFLDSLEKVRLPEEFFTRIDILCNDAEIGWRRLCSLENVFLAVIGPPPASENWFWEPFFQFPERRAVLTRSEIPDRFKTSQVNYDEASYEVDDAEIDTAIQAHSQLLTVLSLLNIPTRVEILADIEPGWNPTELFKRWPKLFVKSFGGYVTRANTRDKVLSRTDAQTLSIARKYCLTITDQMGQSEKPYLKELRIKFCLDNEDYDAALKEYSDLLHLYRQNNEQIPLLRAVMSRRYSVLNERLSAWEKIQTAGLFLKLGEQRQAKYWLSNSNPQNPLDIPLKLSLEAEITKNDGNINQARALIEQAIDACKKNKDNTSLKEDNRKIAAFDFLRYRHDRARLLQFQERNYSEAAHEYQEIIKISEKDNLIDLLAVTHRNLGECILDWDNGPIVDRTREAESHYQSALDLERQISQSSHLIAETHYQLARLAEHQSRLGDMRQELDNCIMSAEEGHHGLMAAIAKNRLLWLDVREKVLGWKDIAQRWELIADSLRSRQDHSWSARTLINSNLKCAKLLMNENQDLLAKERLQENLGIARGNANLRREGDLIRIIRTLAGLHIYASQKAEKQDYWGLLNSEFAEAGELAKALGWSGPGEAW